MSEGIITRRGVPPSLEVTGVTVSLITDGGVSYRVHTFTTSGIFEVSNGSVEVEYLVVAGGGGGGSGWAGGGGAGGYRSSVVGESSGGGASAESKLEISSGSYTVTVGAGGALDANGQDSVFATVTSIGGGTSGSIGTKNGTAGGSGGGAGGNESGFTFVGGAGTAGQGYAGGSATTGFYLPAAGGGGASAVGANGAGGTGAGGAGGAGVSSSINGTATFRACGGGGGQYNG